MQGSLTMCVGGAREPDDQGRCPWRNIELNNKKEAAHKLPRGAVRDGKDPVHLKPNSVNGAPGVSQEGTVHLENTWTEFGPSVTVKRQHLELQCGWSAKHQHCR